LKPSSSWSLLSLPLAEFVKRQTERIREEERSKCSWIFSVCSRPDSKLFDAMKAMCETGCHRTWILNERGCLAGVVSASDVLKCTMMGMDKEMNIKCEGQVQTQTQKEEHSTDETLLVTHDMSFVPLLRLYHRLIDSH